MWQGRQGLFKLARCGGPVELFGVAAHGVARFFQGRQTRGAQVLVQRAAEIDWKWFDSINTLGLTAGASAPDILIEEVIAALKERFEVTLEEVAITRENVTFNIPRILREAEEKVA